ncbi:MAG: L,D-transpeptidase [Anaerolineae bacterium]|nr:L,D-transpeptidase [Anaerolineae bacterium]
MHYSRRTFLKLTGVLLSSAALPGWLFTPERAAQAYGRALEAASVYRGRSTHSTLVTRLWPDSVIELLDADENWYQIEQGFVARHAIQPMNPATASNPPNGQPFWAEVCGPVAAVRAYCAADAPLLARIGHGGTARVIDRLPGQPVDWYGLAGDDGALWGWTQASLWQPAALPTLALDYRLVIDTQSSQLTALDGDDVLLRAPFSLGAALPAGIYTAGEKRVNGTAAGYHGVPWLITFGGQQIAGAYWHNRFGAPAAGPAVQLAPGIARWLYASLDEQHVIEVI